MTDLTPTSTDWADQAPRRHLHGCIVQPACVDDGTAAHPLIVLGFPGLEDDEPITVQLVATTKQFRRLVQTIGEAVTIANSLAVRRQEELDRGRNS